MIKFENTEVMNFRNALRGMRNPMNSWNLNDSLCCGDYVACVDCPNEFEICGNNIEKKDLVKIGDNDLKLAQNLIKAGTEHSKFMRQIFVSVDITAPFYWWKQFDTYKIGTVANSCSTMHKLNARPIMLQDFSHEYLLGESLNMLLTLIDLLNELIKNGDIISWNQLIQLLPEGYNQKRTVTLNYEVIKTIYRQRKHHKLDEWKIGFVEWIESLPFAKELIML